jgi:Tol biopolymer transport system component
VLKTVILPPEKTNFIIQGDVAGAAVISRDGTRVAFVAQGHGPAAIWVRPVDSLSALRLDGTDGASFPFWSWDGKEIGYFAGGKLMRIAAIGGVPSIITDAPNGRGATWSPDNTILLSPGVQSPIFKVSARGGQQVPVTALDSTQHTTHRWPIALPDGKHFIYYATSHSGGDPSRFGIFYASLDGKTNRLLTQSHGAGEYASGYLLFHIQTRVVAQRFDPDTGELSGEPMKVVEGVQHDRGVWRSVFSASQTGLLVYHEGVTAALKTRLEWLDRTGKQIGVVGEEPYNSARISPDGKKIAVMIGDPSADLWTIDIASGIKSRLTFKEADGNALGYPAAWSPDGRWLVRSVTSKAGRSGNNLEIRSASGREEGKRQIPAEPGTSSMNPQWTPDAKYILYLRQTPTGSGIYGVASDGNGAPFEVFTPPNGTAVVVFRIAPNGRWIAYVSNETGQLETYITSFPNPRGKWQISNNLASYPTWRGDSKELFFLASSDLSMHSVQISEGVDGIEIGKSERLFSQHFTGFGTPYDVTPDGKRFLGNTVPSQQSSPMIVVSDWLAAMEK